MHSYSEKLPDGGDKMTVSEFLQAVDSGFFIDYDGFGHPVKGDKMMARVYIKPSAPEEIPKDATHIMWFNR